MPTPEQVRATMSGWTPAFRRMIASEDRERSSKALDVAAHMVAERLAIG